jgi:isopropylmalate/homocitrate/citramalate synthase
MLLVDVRRDVALGYSLVSVWVFAMTKPWATDKWWVSTYNFCEDVLSRTDMPKAEEITISDCTLRDGEQQAGIVFGPEEKFAIAEMLDDVGIPEIEAGMPVVSEEEKRAVKQIAKAGFNARITCLARALRKDIDAALECDVWGVRISIPTGYLWRKYMINRPMEEILSMGIETAQYANDHGLYVIGSLTDCTRAELDHLKMVVSSLVKEAKVDQIRLPDTVGCITPIGMEYLVREVRKVSGDVPVEVHPHDDFGLATANALAAVYAGARCLSVCVNGLGERSGNAATEEVVLALRILHGMDLGLRYEKLCELSKLVEKLSRMTVQANKAVVGANTFAHDSGESIAGLLKNEFVASAYLPEVVGQTRRILLGKKSGRHVIDSKLRNLGVTANDAQLSKILDATKKLGERKKTTLSDEEFEAIVKKVVPGAGAKTRCLDDKPGEIAGVESTQ